MKKKILIFAMLIAAGVSVFAKEIKCRKETYVYENSCDEFYFIGNFILFPHNYGANKYVIFYKESDGSYASFGEYFPAYMGNGRFSEAAYGSSGFVPRPKETKVETVLFEKNDFYRLLADAFYACYLTADKNNSKDSGTYFNFELFMLEIKDLLSKDDLRIPRNTVYAKYGLCKIRLRF